ncbi:hypothetical protein FQ154_01705 [Paeniglutamicibacter gangotriensis]|uniref:Uncharacterized protein n=1 Tax=Paeniglutamicibacter gangotriensis TaxID=254787 RepID=A0A5B0EQB0_9MICC|nr:hypothetical protein [Paeniglutamicibacter gangotriensis]KAA0979900.1 hypothetical protein FQ154_01705 [Paeniglutamicibacter gangotriensis]
MARVTDDGTVAAAVARWKGDPTYAPGQIVNGKTICGAKKRKDQEPCGAPPINGATRCGRHGAKSPAVAQKAKERVIETNARGILGRIDPEAPREHPVETLLNLIRAKNAEVQWLRSKVQALEDEELVWGLASHREGLGPEGPIDVKEHRADQSVWWKLLREAENQLANWITMALKAGVEDRRVRLAESQGGAVAGAIRQILDGLNLTTEQAALIPVLVPNALRQLTGDAT